MHLQCASGWAESFLEASLREEAHRAHAVRIRALYARVDGACWGANLLPALARIHEQLADEVLVTGVEAREAPRKVFRTRWDAWVEETLHPDPEDAWNEKTFWGAD